MRTWPWIDQICVCVRVRVYMCVCVRMPSAFHRDNPLESMIEPDINNMQLNSKQND